MGLEKYSYAFRARKDTEVYASRLLTEVARQSEIRLETEAECVDRTRGPAKLFAFAIVILLSRFSFVLESRNILLVIRTLRWTMQRDTCASFSLSFSDRVAGRWTQRWWKRNELALSEETTRFRFDEIVYRFDSTGFDGIRLAARRAQTGNERASSGG